MVVPCSYNYKEVVCNIALICEVNKWLTTLQDKIIDYTFNLGLRNLKLKVCLLEALFTIFGIKQLAKFVVDVKL